MTVAIVTFEDVTSQRIHARTLGGPDVAASYGIITSLARTPQHRTLALHLARTVGLRSVEDEPSVSEDGTHVWEVVA